MDPDILIVGAGLFGLTMAERLANVCGKRVLIIDKRDHIGGNCYSEFDSATGIECHKYGAHLFHTSDEEVWQYVNRFTKFTPYIHKVYTTHDGEVYPLPINLGTINQFFHAAYTPDAARQLIAEQSASAPTQPTNLVANWAPTFRRFHQKLYRQTVANSRRRAFPRHHQAPPCPL